MIPRVKWVLLRRTTAENHLEVPRGAPRDSGEQLKTTDGGSTGGRVVGMKADLLLLLSFIYIYFFEYS